MRRRLDAAGYQEVKTPQLVDRSLWERSGHWEKFRQHMFIAQVAGRGQNARAEADELPVPHPDLPPGPALLSRAAAAAGGVRLLPPLRAVGRAARHHAGARVHPGRCAHLLHRSSRSPPRRCGSWSCCPRSTAISASRNSRVKFSDRPALRVGVGRGVGPGGGRAEGGLRHRRRGLHAEPRRGRVLWPQAGVRAARRDRPRLAVRHAAGRFHHAGAAGRRIRRRGRRAPPPGDAAPRHHGQLRAVPRHRDRALCRPVPALAGAGAGGGGDHRLGRRRLCAGRCGGDSARPGCTWNSISPTRRSTPRCANTAWRMSRCWWWSAGGRPSSGTVALRRLGGDAQEVLALDEAVRRLAAEATPPDLRAADPPGGVRLIRNGRIGQTCPGAGDCPARLACNNDRRRP